MKKGDPTEVKSRLPKVHFNTIRENKPNPIIAQIHNSRYPTTSCQPPLLILIHSAIRGDWYV